MNSVKTHPVSQAELLLYAEGELASNAYSRMRSHILGCTDCQVELENLRDGIKMLIHFHNDSALPVPEPPQPWEPLDVQIEMWEKRWKAGFLFESLRATLKPRYALAAMAAALLAVVCLILQPWYETVSANELLARASLAQSKSLSSTRGRIIHQRLRIHRKSGAHGRENDKTISYESWQDDSRKHFHESSSLAEISGELEHVYQVNHLDWKSPLSAAAYERWQSSLAEKQASVARNGSAGFTLTTIVSDQPEGDAIGKAQFVVSTTDWLPMVVHLWLNDREYEISEVSSELLLPSQISPSLFDAPATTQLQTAAMAVKQSSGPRRIEGTSPPTLTSLATAFVPEQSPVEPSKPSTEAPAQIPASEQAAVANCEATNAAAPVTPQNVPDAPSPALATAQTTTFTPVWTSTVTASTGTAPRSHKSSDITLTYQPDNADRRVSGLETQAITVAPLLVPNIVRPRPFKAFESSTVVITNPQAQHPMQPCPIKALGNKLGILKQKKTEPVASAKPGG
jgi:hypothetical protein